MNFQLRQAVRTAPLEELTIPNTNRYGIALKGELPTITDALLTQRLPWYSYLVKGEVSSVKVPYSLLSRMKQLGGERNEIAGYLLGTLRKGAFQAFGMQELAIGSPDRVAFDDLSTVPPHRRVTLIVETLLMKARIPDFSVMLFHSHPNLAHADAFFSESEWQDICLNHERQIQRGDYDFLKSYYHEVGPVQTFGWEAGADLSPTDLSHPTSAQILLRSSLPVGDPLNRIVCYDTRSANAGDSEFLREIPISIPHFAEDEQKVKEIRAEVEKSELIADRVFRELFGNEYDSSEIIRKLARQEITTRADIPVASRSEQQVDNLWKIASLWRAVTPETPAADRTILSPLYGAGIILPALAELIPISLSPPEVLTSPVSSRMLQLSDIVKGELPLRIADLKEIWHSNNEALQREIKDYDASRICLQGLRPSVLQEFAGWCSSSATSLPPRHAWPCWGVNRIFKSTFQVDSEQKSDLLNFTSEMALALSHFTYHREPLGAVLVFVEPGATDSAFIHQEPSRTIPPLVLDSDSPRFKQLAESCYDDVVRLCTHYPYQPPKLYRGMVMGNQLTDSFIDPAKLDQTNRASLAISVLLQRIYGQRLSACVLAMLKS